MTNHRVYQERLPSVWKTREFRGEFKRNGSSRRKFSGKKVNSTFRGITFYPFLPKRPKFSVPFFWITSATLQVERKRKIPRYFVNGTTQSRSCFQCQKKYQYHLTEIFHRNFRTNDKRSNSWCTRMRYPSLPSSPAVFAQFFSMRFPLYPGAWKGLG